MNEQLSPKKKKPIYIAFATQKGGAGKSSFSILMASMAHYTSERVAAIIDCDYPQLSIYNMRKRELDAISKNETLYKEASNQFTKHNKTAYTIIESNAIDALKVANKIAADSPEVEYVFFDLPGTVNQPGIIELVSQMDYIFTPIAADRTVVESSISFLTMLHRLVEIGQSKVKSFAFWNMVDGREKTGLYIAYDSIMDEFNIPVLKTTIPYGVRFHKEATDSQGGIFRSTLLAPTRASLTGSGIDSLYNEIFQIIDKK